VPLTSNPSSPFVGQFAGGGVTNGYLVMQYTVDFNDSPSPTNPANGVVVARLTWPFRNSRVFPSGSSLVLEWTGGKPPFKVSSTTDLGLNVWNELIFSTPNTNATVPLPTSGSLFYRVSGQP